MIKSVVLSLALTLGLGISASNAQNKNVYVDDSGIMRWEDSDKEVQGFGVNYTVPFAHAYRSAEKLGVDKKEAIDNDVYHFARLGFDAYRIHVWDTEISDSLGNLLENDHLDLFDYMVKKMEDRGMKMLITPIAFWDNGWPEPGEDTPGFSNKYGKNACLTNEDAIAAQENYLYQFLNHTNPYTGLAYKNDPAVVAFEISNEPHHRQEADSVTRYIKKMVTSMRNTGCEKPIFYNISHSIHLVNAYFDAGVQGGTFQWYPTGLGAGEELEGNFLPNVDLYEIPFAKNSKFKKAAKVVYEFDAADVGRSYIYPAMARSFRTAGIQWATHFAYDPTYLAYANTEYNTHYMNLAYTPQKALSLKLAGEVFHRVPVYKDFGAYPENTQFDGFRVSYEEDLAELLTEKKFIYTNTTKSIPPSPTRLNEVAGYGNSSVVQYAGTGAYFLDQLEKGVWRLEVMPDAVWVEDPFGKNSLQRKLSEIRWGEWPMTIDLPDLGADFVLKPINEGNGWRPAVAGKRFIIKPGTYLIARSGVKTKLQGVEKWKNITLNEFSAPMSTLEKQYVLHEPAAQISQGSPYEISATVLAPSQPERVEVLAYIGWRPKTYVMENSGYSYMATIPAEDIKAGFFSYFITVKGQLGTQTYPGAVTGLPGDWDFEDNNAYVVKVLSNDSPVYLFDALADNDKLSRAWSPQSSFVPLAEAGKAEIRIKVARLKEVDAENPNGEQVADYSMRYAFREKVSGRVADLADKKELVLTGRSLTDEPTIVQLALVAADGKTYGGLLELGPKLADYRLSLDELKEVKMVTLPRPYPSFLPYYFEGASRAAFDIRKAEVLQISVGPGIQEVEKPQALAIVSVRLE